MSDISVVLDTNIFVAAGFNSQSHSARVLDQVRDARVRLVWNEVTRDEIRATLQQIPPLSWERVARLFRPEDRFEGEVHPENYCFVPDPADGEFIALAEAADAILVSHDGDLLVHSERASVPVLTSAEFPHRDAQQ
ncbi:MAG: PIN domain-containing protein [Anaerolineae bacterium]